MSNTVWTLSADLEARTATFKSGMSDAAKTARSAFADIQGGSSDMSDAVKVNTFESRHSVMLLAEEFGVHLPRALTAFIASIGPVGEALEAAFPFLAIAVGATMLIEHLVKMHEAGEKLTEDQVRFATAVQSAFNTLEDKLLQAQIRSDELHHNHLGALAKQLELIDHQSMNELIHSFEEIAKTSDAVFADLKKSWYQFGSGSDGAKHSLEGFTTAYKAALTSGDAKGASDLLQAKLERETRILALQQQAKNALAGETGKGGTDIEDHLKYVQATNELKAEGAKWDKDAIASERVLVDILNAQAKAQGEINKTKGTEGDNAKLSTASQMAGQSSAAARAAADSALRINESKLAAQRAGSNAELELMRASGDEREAVEMAFADRELQVRLTANRAELNALNTYADDCQNQRKALLAKAQELEQQHTTSIAQIHSRAAIAENAQDLQALEQGIREAIEATERGSAARLAAIDAGLKTEAARNLQDLSSYRDLLTQRVQTVREAAAEEAKLRADAGKEAAENDARMRELALAAQQESQAVADSARHMTLAMQIAEETQAANALYAIKKTLLDREIDALDQSGKDYTNKLKSLLNQELQLQQQHENQVTAIKDKAEIDRNSKIMTAERQFNDTLTAGLAQVLMGHKSFASVIDSIGNQVVSGIMQNAIKTMEANLIGKESDAMKAARTAYNIGLGYGGPIGMVLAPTFATVAFSTMMAYETGTDYVPGATRGDSVPAMLTPGEGVVPGGVMDGLRGIARSGGFNQQPTIHAPVHFAPVIQAIDATGVDKMLTKHASAFQKHFETTVRKMNR